MMDMMDFDKFYIPAAMNILGCSEDQLRDMSDNYKTFDAMLGVDLVKSFLARRTYQDGPMPDDWKAFLTALAGPHGKTILRAYQIKYGVTYEEA